MPTGERRPARAALIWGLLTAVIVIPIAASFTSPFLEWRGPVYIGAGVAGMIALGLLLVQPALMAGYLPGLTAMQARRVHRWVGGAIVIALLLHVAGLWVTSPPDMADALLFRSPTPFSPFGVVAMWAVLAVAVLAAVRRKLGLRTWRIAHMSLAAVIVVGSAVHAMLVEGTMETMTKAALCALVLAATVKVIVDVGLRNKKPAR